MLSTIALLYRVVQREWKGSHTSKNRYSADGRHTPAADASYDFTRRVHRTQATEESSDALKLASQQTLQLYQSLRALHRTRQRPTHEGPHK